jgi:hypothetical protein
MKRDGFEKIASQPVSHALGIDYNYDNYGDSALNCPVD